MAHIKTSFGNMTHVNTHTRARAHTPTRIRTHYNKRCSEMHSVLTTTVSRTASQRTQYKSHYISSPFNQHLLHWNHSLSVDNKYHYEHIGFSAARFTSSLAVFPKCFTIFVPLSSIQLFVGDRLHLGFFVLAW